MSSSRSIAAARNKRAGEQPVHQQQYTNRPGTSIAAQPAFSQQQPMQKQHLQQQQQPPQQHQQQMQQKGSTKLTISDAIGLITLRLGRVEQILQEGEFGHGSSSSSSAGIPDGTQIVDKSVINSIINRLDSLEKKDKESTGNSNTQLTKFDKEIRDIKDALMIQMVKYEKFSVETDKRFSDIDAAFIELEKNLPNDIEVETADAQTEMNASSTIFSLTSLTSVTSESDADSQAIVSGDLKNMIKQEFASEIV